jgi:predicted transcriptional regulator of viral defense system
MLSAASMYGATNQQPMVFQVITTLPRRNIKLERTEIEFYSFKESILASKEKISSPAGYANISTKEQTIVDLVRFYDSCGYYLSNRANVIKELLSENDTKEFKKVISNEKTTSVLQRLGYILEIVNYTNLSAIVLQELSHRNTQQIYLSPDSKVKTGNYNSKFKVIINNKIELEE